MERNRSLEAFAMVLGAVATGAGIVLYAVGETKAAAAVGVTGLLVSTTLGAARVLAGDDEGAAAGGGGA